MTLTLQNNKKYWLFFGLILIVIAWCANPWQLYFLNDDFIHIPIAYDGTIGHNKSVRHINDLSLYLDSLLSKENAVGYHITNLLLHLANIIMGVFLLRDISRSLQVSVSTGIYVLIMALFGIYAFHSEALFWILCRTASLSFFFNVISWLCLFKAMQNRWWLVPMSAAFFLGIFTYESLWVFPFWLLTWYFLLPKNGGQKSVAVLPIIVIWALFILYFPVRWKVTGELLGSYEANDVQKAHLLPIIEKSFKLLARSFLPPVYSHKLFLVLFTIVLLGLAWLGWLLWKGKKADRLFLFFVLAWLVSYFPYISLGVSTTGYESERYLYFPSFFLCAVLVYGAALLWQNKPGYFSTFIVGIFAYQLFFFIKVSQDFKTICVYSKQSIEAIKNVPPQQRIVIRNLPVYSHGLPIFNYGFAEAVAWMVPGRDTATVMVMNKTNFEKQKIGIAKQAGTIADTLIFYGR